MSSYSKETVGTEVRSGADDVTPSEPGSFLGDIFFGDPLKTTRGTHRWDGAQWVELPDERVSLMELLANARAQRDDLLEAARKALDLLAKGAPGWGVAKDILRTAISKAEGA